MNLQLAIESPFRDPDWVRKAIVGSLVALIALPLFFIGFPLLYGWGLETAARVARGEDPTLPDWADMGGFFVDGFKLWLANAVWMAPFSALLLLVALGPLALLPATEDSRLFLVLPFAIGLASLPVFVISLTFPLQFGVAAKTRSFLATINPIRVINFVRDSPREVAYAWLVSAGSQYILGSIGFYLFCIGWFPSLLYIYTLWGQVFGQILRQES